MQEGISTQASFLPVFLRLLEKKRYRTQCFQPYITIFFVQFALHKRMLLVSTNL